MRQINIILLFIICFDLNAQKIKVHENHLPSPLVKSGWNLIFQDEFDSLQLNKTVWNIAGFNNDGTLHCSDPNDYPFTCGTSLQNSALFVTPEFNEACLMRVDNTTADNTSNSNSEDLQNESIQTISVVNFNTLINILNEIQEPLEVHIYSLSGQVVSTFPLQHIQYNKIESLSAGLYLIIFFDAKHAITNKLYLYK